MQAYKKGNNMPDDSKLPNSVEQTPPSTTSLDDTSASISPDQSQAPANSSGSSQVIAQSPTPQTPAAPAPAQPSAPAPKVIGTVPPPQPDVEAAHAIVDAGKTPVVSHVRKKNRSVLLIAAVLVLILLLAGGYVFAFYLPNTPGHVFSESLTRSGLALDRLVDYSKTQQQTGYNSVATNGNIQVKSPSASYTITASGNADKNGNSTDTVQADILGENITANVRTVVSHGNTTPDFFVQISGIKSFLDSLGANGLDKYDGKWIVIDHTLIDTYESSIKNTLGTKSGSSSVTGLPAYSQVQDAVSRIQAVNKQYLFTTNTASAVLTNQKYVGQQTVNGRVVYQYQVGYDKAHLLAYVSAIGSAFDASQLNSWSKQVNSGESLSDAMDLSSLKTAVQNAKSNYTFNLWADKSTKLITKLEFDDSGSDLSKFTVSQNYTGGNVYPFSFNMAGKSSDGNSYNATVGLNLNTSTNKVTATVNASSDTTSGTTTINGDFSFAPSKNQVQVTAPSGATSFTNLLLSLGLNSSSISDSLTPTGSGSRNGGSLLPVNAQ